MTCPIRIVAVSVAALAGTAAAQSAIASFTFSDLLGSYDTNSGMYTAVNGGATSGDVSRLVGPEGTAEFDTGSFVAPSLAGYGMQMMVSNISGGTADGNGTLTITDDNGDTLTANVDGQFRVFAGSVAYEGVLTNVFFNDNSGDGTFDGSTSGSFSTALPGTPPYDGSVVSLFFNPGAFFGTGFQNQITLSSGLIVPAPTTLAAFGALGLLASRRRR